MVKTMCGEISSRRGLLASLWFLVSILTAVAFLTALIFAMSSKGSEYYDDDYYNRYNNNNNQVGEGSRDEYEMEPEIAVTSRALAFSALWTAVLWAIMSVFGTVILGWQSPTGQYYNCCAKSVHKTTPLGLGSFIGSLLMFANLTLISSILFGEFEIRDFREGEDKGGGDFNGVYYTRVERSCMAFSVMCMFLTVVYGSFAAFTFIYANGIVEEHALDDREESMLSSRDPHHPRPIVGHFNQGYDGYIGGRFDVGVRPLTRGPAPFVTPTPADGTLT